MKRDPCGATNRSSGSSYRLLSTGDEASPEFTLPNGGSSWEWQLCHSGIRQNSVLASRAEFSRIPLNEADYELFLPVDPPQEEPVLPALFIFQLQGLEGRPLAQIVLVRHDARARFELLLQNGPQAQVELREHVDRDHG